MQLREQTRPTPHPEAPDGKGWTHVAVRQEPPPPPIYVPPPKLRPWLLLVGALLGYAIAMGQRDWQLHQANQRADKNQAALESKQQAIDTFCQGAMRR